MEFLCVVEAPPPGKRERMPSVFRGVGRSGEKARRPGQSFFFFHSTTRQKGSPLPRRSTISHGMPCSLARLRTVFSVTPRYSATSLTVTPEPVSHAANASSKAAERAEERLLTVLRQEVNYEIHKALAKAR